MCGRKDKFAEGHRPYSWVNSSELSVPSPKVHGVIGQLPITSGGTCSQTRASVGTAEPSLPAGQGRLPWGQPRLTMLCPDSMLTKHKKQWRKDISHQLLLGCLCPSSAPSLQQECRHVRLWGCSFVPLATSPSLHPQPDPGRDYSRGLKFSGPHSPASTLGSLVGKEQSHETLQGSGGFRDVAHSRASINDSSS